jgi:hypothetical protein
MLAGLVEDRQLVPRERDHVATEIFVEGVEGGPDERWRGGLLGGGGRSGSSRGEGTIAEGGGGGSIIGRLDAPAEAEEGAGRGSEHG